MNATIANRKMKRFNGGHFKKVSLMQTFEYSNTILPPSQVAAKLL